MPRSTQRLRWLVRLRDSRSHISAELVDHAYSAQQLRSWFHSRTEAWSLPKALSFEFFLQYLSDTRLLRQTRLALVEPSLAPRSYPRERVAYVTPTATPFDIALVLRSTSYLSHGSAAFVRGMTELLPRTVVVNAEQAPKQVRPSAPLEQDSLDRVFARPARATRNVYRGGGAVDFQVMLLSGEHTGNLDVEMVSSHDGHRYLTTSLERTLVDLAVRPAHGGGIHQVLAVYQAAVGEVSVRRIRKLLGQLNFAYPYHQAIGFLLERAGHPRGRTEPLRALGLSRDFYLEHGMASPVYDERWRLYCPPGF